MKMILLQISYVNKHYLGKLIKTYFGTDYLSEVNTFLNNNDRLRYYKKQKEIHPQGQELLGVIYKYSRNINNFCDYVKRLGKYYIANKFKQNLTELIIYFL